MAIFKDMQDAYDQTVAHLEKQGEQAQNTNSAACVYLSDSGQKCAIGAFIPDGHPAQNSRGCVKKLFHRFPSLKQDVFTIPGATETECLSFWISLQQAHDNASDTEQMHEYLQKIAGHWGLTPKTVTSWKGAL
tara:strand:- start:4158 stop:4556 length:399 start_codon:yes stop_codon:yes gene_type:complete